MSNLVYFCMNEDPTIPGLIFIDALQPVHNKFVTSFLWSYDRGSLIRTCGTRNPVITLL